jgi:nitrous oxide reductase
MSQLTRRELLKATALTALAAGTGGKAMLEATDTAKAAEPSAGMNLNL